MVLERLFQQNASQEITYQRHMLNAITKYHTSQIQQVRRYFLTSLDDIYATSLLICTGLYTKNVSEDYTRLTKGIKRIHDLIISENYNHYSAIVNASKAAYLSVLISKGINTFQRYDKTVNLNHIQIGEPVPTAINKLKTIRPEAFFYWHQIEKLLTQQ